MADVYLHGYTIQEQERLRSQARFLEHRVFEKVDFSKVNSLLELGCGVGAQTEILLKRFSHISILAVDLNPLQIAAAHQNERVQFLKGDATQLPLEAQSFDGVFICWFLEHVREPLLVLQEAKRLLKKGGVLFATEVMNSSFYLYPEKPSIKKYWEAYNELQIQLGGDPQVGGKLGNLLLQSGFSEVQTWPLFFHLDQRNPNELKEMLTYWKNLLLSGHESLVQHQKVDKSFKLLLEEEIEELKQSPDTVFIYTSIQGRGLV